MLNALVRDEPLKSGFANLASRPRNIVLWYNAKHSQYLESLSGDSRVLNGQLRRLHTDGRTDILVANATLTTLRGQ